MDPAAQGGGEGLGVDGLGDVVVHAQGQATVPLFHHGVGGHGQDRQVAEPGLQAQAAGGFVTVHDGHLQIHEHQVEGAIAQPGQGFLAVAGENGLHAHQGQ